VLAIYAPVVTETAISFETEPPTVDEMRARIRSTLSQYPWLVALDDEAGSPHEAVGFTRVGVYASAGYKLGRWHDVGYWQFPLQRPDPPPEPRAPSA
jgi:L-amino acid N-acyltransferase YncA